jgi:hypothetical protein
MTKVVGDAPDAVGHSDDLYVKAAYTTCAIRLPEAQGLVVGLDVGREKEGITWAGAPGTPQVLKATGPQAWIGHPLDDMGYEDWRAAWRGRARQEVVEEIIGRPVNDLLERTPPRGFRIEFKFGTLVLTQRGFLEQPEELDQFAQTASWLAGQLRAICAGFAEPQPFGTELPAAPWTAKIEELPDDKFHGLHGQDLKQAHLVARERGLLAEDPFAFHLAFPYLPVPGEAFGVYRGTLPGTAIQGRLVNAIERPLANPPAGWKKYLKEMPWGEFGCDSVLFPLRPDVEDAHSAVGELFAERARYAIRRGVFVGWRGRISPQADGGELDALTADAVAFATEQGLL